MRQVGERRGPARSRPRGRRRGSGRARRRAPAPASSRWRSRGCRPRSPRPTARCAGTGWRNRLASQPRPKAPGAATAAVLPDELHRLAARWPRRPGSCRPGRAAGGTDPDRRRARRTQAMASPRRRCWPARASVVRVSAGVDSRIIASGSRASDEAVDGGHPALPVGDEQGQRLLVVGDRHRTDGRLGEDPEPALRAEDELAEVGAGRRRRVGRQLERSRRRLEPAARRTGASIRPKPERALARRAGRRPSRRASRTPRTAARGRAAGRASRSAASRAGPVTPAPNVASPLRSSKVDEAGEPFEVDRQDRALAAAGRPELRRRQAADDGRATAVRHDGRHPPTRRSRGAGGPRPPTTVGRPHRAPGRAWPPRSATQSPRLWPRACRTRSSGSSETSGWAGSRPGGTVARTSPRRASGVGRPAPTSPSSWAIAGRGTGVRTASSPQPFQRRTMRPWCAFEGRRRRGVDSRPWPTASAPATPTSSPSGWPRRTSGATWRRVRTVRRAGCSTRSGTRASAGATVLDIGGGIGAVQLELLAAGAATDGVGRRLAGVRGRGAAGGGAAWSRRPDAPPPGRLRDARAGGRAGRRRDPRPGGVLLPGDAGPPRAVRRATPGG